MNTLSPAQRATLYCRSGTSDKVYQVALEPAGSRFVVNVAHGRRGSTLSTSTKTNVPVELPRAQAIYAQVLREKTAKGYTQGSEGVPYQHPEDPASPTGLLPMLLHGVEVDAIESLLESQDWVLQEKFDGRRVLLRKVGHVITGFNRRGLVIGLPTSLLEALANLPDDVVLDGECVGDRFHAFDLLRLQGEDYGAQPLLRRLAALVNLLGPRTGPCLQVVNTAYGTDYKRLLFAEIQAGGREGVVFKRLDAPYTPGRPHRGGPALKHKFTATLSALVARSNEQRSVALELLGPEGWQSAGNVAIPPNQPLPRPGDVVEVRYLYAFPESGVLFQPVCLGVRTDVLAIECVVDQLKFKANDEED